MITRPIAACLRIPIPFLYLASSPAAVTIWKPPQRQIIRAIRANIPKIQFTALVIVSSKLELDAPSVAAFAVHETQTQATPLAFQNQAVVHQASSASVMPLILPNAANHIIITASNFVFMLFKIIKFKRFF